MRPLHRALVLAGLLAALCGGTAHAAAPAPPDGVFYQWTAPAGAPRGVMLVIHGGGWFLVGKQAAMSMQGQVRRYARAGWRVLNISYRPGGQSLQDVLAFYRYARARHPELPFCAAGSSAGAHLALMLASWRPSVACVIGRGAPTDLPNLGPNVRETMARPAFGDRLWHFSPLRWTHRIRARVLLATAATDDVIPPRQAEAYARRRPKNTRFMLLQPGDQEFVHADVSRRDLNRYHAAERQLLRMAGRPATRR